MPINFPDSPTNGQEITHGDGKLVYNSAKGIWNHFSTAAAAESSGGGGASVTTSDTAPTSPNSGDQWFDTTSGTLYVYYNDGTSSQWIGVSGPSGADGADGTGGAAVTAYANFAAFSNGTTEGDFAFAQDTKALYMWNGTEWDRIYSGDQESVEWTTEPVDTLRLNSNGTTSTITGVAVDPDSFPITYSYDTNPTNPAQVVSVVNNNDGSFTITPSTTDTDAGSFIFRTKASDGISIIRKSTTIDLQFSYTSIAAAYADGASDDVHQFKITGVNNNQPFDARYASYNNKGWIEILFSEVADRSHVHGGTSGANYLTYERWTSSSNSGWDNLQSYHLEYMKSHRNTVATMGPSATTLGGLDYTSSSSFMMLGPNINATDVVFTTKNSKTANGIAPTGGNQNGEYPLIASTGTNNATLTTNFKNYFTGNGPAFYYVNGWDGKSPKLTIALGTRDGANFSADHWMIATGDTGSSTYRANYGYRDNSSYASYDVGNWESGNVTHPNQISSTNVMSIWITDG
jgi:hypothetical protein